MMAVMLVAAYGVIAVSAFEISHEIAYFDAKSSCCPNYAGTAICARNHLKSGDGCVCDEYHYCPKCKTILHVYEEKTTIPCNHTKMYEDVPGLHW